MEKERGHMTERILNLTLEIIYLLTGEDYTLVKNNSGDQMTPRNQPSHSGRWSRKQRGGRIHTSPPSQTPEGSDKKILEVTQKIMELLTGEVPIRCQDVTVYFSMEEWEYLEGHKDLYKDIMMEKRPPLTSPDKSRKMNPPERCPQSLDSRDYTQEHQKIPQKHQKIPQKHQKIPQEHQKITQTRPLDSWDSGEIPQPLHLWDSTQEHQELPRADQREDVTIIKAEGLEEAEEAKHIESYQGKEIPSEIHTDSRDTRATHRDVKGGDKVQGRLKEEEVPVEISTDGRYRRYKTEDCPLPSLNDVLEDSDIIEDPSGINPTIPIVQPAPHITDLPSNPSTHEGTMTDHLYPGTYTVCGANGPFPCYVSNNCYSPGSHLISQSNPGVTPSCSECGTCFNQASSISRRGVAKSYPCSECGRCFSQKSNLHRHLRFHTVVKPYMCSACGRCFSQKSDLLRHQRIHTGEKPYSCLVCGRGFAQKSNLLRHHRSHSGEKPFSCTECRKSFAKKQDMIAHQIKHTK